MLQLDGLTLRRGSRLLLQNASLTIQRGWRVGVVGRNGSGKSSLFALVRGDLAADQGELRLPAGLTIAHVAQEIPGGSGPALRYVLEGDEELDGLTRAVNAAEARGDGHALGELHARMEAIGGYAAPSRAARIMRGLGFQPGQEDAPVGSLSGGWRVRLALARALMCRSDLLLLDEPTNHLDLDAVLWLEQWLQAYPGTLLAISHDRDFLDQVSDHMLHLEPPGARLYAGNYSEFESQRAARLAGEQAYQERCRKEAARIRSFVDRFRAKATKAKQVQSRLKMLDRMEAVSAAHADDPITFSFLPPRRQPAKLLELDRASVGYGDGAPLLEDLRLVVHGADRLGLVGANGAGKSTLVKLLVGELAAAAGRVERAPGLCTGYFAQHSLEQLREDDTPLAHCQPLAPDWTEQALRDFLGGFGFQGDAAVAPVAPLSGGERARLVLAMLILQRPNLLLLDEPTNHLDLDTRHALTLALQDYPGALVLVSHDRHLIRSVTDDLLLVDAGRVQRFAGDVDDYARLRQSRSDQGTPGGEPPDGGGASRRDARRAQAEARRRLQPLKKRLAGLEQEMARLGRENAELEHRLAEPGLYEEGRKPELLELLGAQRRVAAALEETEEAWLALGQELEEAQAEEAELPAGGTASAG